jgi:hypothetical protein
MDPDWWKPAAQFIAVIAVTTVTMGWLSRSRLQPRADAPAGELRYPPSHLILGLLGLAFCGWLAISSKFYPGDATERIALSLVSTAIFFPWTLSYFRARHQVSEAGLNFGRVFGSRGDLKWSELRRVRYSPALWFRLETGSGRVARISPALQGLPELARALLQHSPPETVEPKTLQVLEETARGNLPPLW